MTQVFNYDELSKHKTPESCWVLEQTLPASAKLGAIDPTTLSANLESLLNIDDLEAAATRHISAKAWAYYYSAADDLVSKTLSTTAYRQILLRPRVLRDCSTVSTATTLLGDDALTVGLPIFASPTASGASGRKALYGLGAGGKEGVSRMFQILKAEIETAMRLLGVEKVEQLGLQHVNARAVERDVYRGPTDVSSAILREKTRARL